MRCGKLYPPDSWIRPHDVSGGGLAVALAEMALVDGVGARVQLLPGGRQEVALFGETGGCILVAVPEERLEDFRVGV